ncbi:TetR family transcriptional regulator [Streptomyces sp. NPDC050315]|uniref:TetR family transcriptional regulator n=1 Tax=Streptomyces sp. NPDC050315 TaxID=3155039 RepID=UPI0034200610
MTGTRDPAATKARIFEAAAAEFAAYGIAGARIDRIAREAKANKQLIYAYFGNKNELFAQVLEQRLVDHARNMPVDADDPDAWVDRLLEYHATHPQLLRLLMWEGLEYGTGAIPREDERTAHWDRKAEVFADAQRRGVIGTALPPRDLAFILLGVAAWYTAMPQMRKILVGDTDEARARLRESIGTAVRRIISKP